MAANEIVKLLTETPILDACKNLPYHVLNVNIPDVDSADAIKGRKITALSHSEIARPVVDPRGCDAYWLSLRKRTLSSELSSEIATENVDAQTSSIEMTDDQAVAAGYISLSPVRLHHTPAATLNTLSALVL